MKKLLIMSAITLLGCSGAFAADSASDNASDAAYNDGWATSDDGGTGFEPWSLSSSGSGGFFISSSVGDGFGDIDTSGESFGMFGNPSGGDSANADRTFTGGALSLGQTFSIDLAIAFRNGNKGIDLDIGGSSVWNFNVGSDLYTVNATDLGWAYSQDSIFELSATQISSTEIAINLTRGSDVHTATNTIGGQLTGFGLYVAGTDAGDALNNLYVNNMDVDVIPEPSTLGLAAIGLAGLVCVRRRKTK